MTRRQAAPPAQRWLLVIVALLAGPWLGQGAAFAYSVSVNPQSGPAGTHVTVILSRLRRRLRRDLRRRTGGGRQAAARARRRSSSTFRRDAPVGQPRDPGRRGRGPTEMAPSQSLHLPGDGLAADDRAASHRRPLPRHRPSRGRHQRGRGRQRRRRSPGRSPPRPASPPHRRRRPRPPAASGPADHVHRRPARRPPAPPSRPGSPPAASRARSPSCASRWRPEGRPGDAVTGSTSWGSVGTCSDEAGAAGDPRRQDRPRGPAGRGHVREVRDDHSAGRRARAPHPGPGGRRRPVGRAGHHRLPGGEGQGVDPPRLLAGAGARAGAAGPAPAGPAAAPGGGGEGRGSGRRRVGRRDDGGGGWGGVLDVPDIAGESEPEPDLAVAPDRGRRRGGPAHDARRPPRGRQRAPRVVLPARAPEPARPPPAQRQAGLVPRPAHPAHPGDRRRPSSSPTPRARPRRSWPPGSGRPRPTS